MTFLEPPLPKKYKEEMFSLIHISSVLHDSYYRMQSIWE